LQGRQAVQGETQTRRQREHIIFIQLQEINSKIKDYAKENI